MKQRRGKRERDRDKKSRGKKKEGKEMELKTNNKEESVHTTFRFCKCFFAFKKKCS